VNAPIQDAYHYDVRPGLQDLWVLMTGANPNAPVDADHPAPSIALRNAGRKLFDLNQLSVAYNLDPSVALGTPGIVSSFDLAVNGNLSLVNWDANAGITEYELAVMAAKLLGQESKVLDVIRMSPTFSDVEYEVALNKTSAGTNASLFFDRAAAYYNYFEKHIVKENKSAFAGYTTKKPGDVASRLDVVELIIRLAQLKFDELKDVSAYVDADFAKQIGFDKVSDKSIVSFAITLDDYLNDGIGWNNTAVNGKVGFLYAFEFFFLSEVKTTEVSPEMLTANQMIELQQNGQDVTLNVPVLFLDEFRVYYDGVTYKMLGRFNETRDFFTGTSYAERFWTVALFSKIFATEKRVVAAEDYVPNREINNVVVYKKNNAKGQLTFGNVEYVEGFNGNKELLTCKNTAYPEYIDPQNPDVDNVLENPELNYYIFELTDGTKVVLTDMTTWDILDANTISTKVGNNFYDYYPNSTTRETTRDYTGYAFYNKDTAMLDDAVIYDDKAINVNDPAFFENSVEMGATYDSYMIFIPTVEDFAKGSNNTLFLKSVQDVVDNPETATSKYVKVTKAMDAKNLVNKEAVIFDAEFKQLAGQPDKVQILYAKDRLNHTDDFLTLSGIETFLKRYYGEFSINENGIEAENFVDRIEALSPEGYADQPMLAYYIHMYKALMAAELPMETKLVAVVKTEKVPMSIVPTFDNFRTVEQLYGQVDSIERFTPDAVAENLIKKHNTVEGTFEPVFTSEYEIYPVITDACVAPIPEPEKIPTGDSFIQGCCAYDLNEGDFIVSFDAYVQNDFVFPGISTMIAEFDANQARTTTAMSTMLDNPELLLGSKFGFTGPAVKELFISRSIKPATPLLEDDSTVILKAYK